MLPHPFPSDAAFLHARKASPPYRSNAMRLCEAVAAAWFALKPDALRHATRGVPRVAFARHVGMYFAHVTFHATMTGAGRAFRRDRTTARYGCAKIEEWRENAVVEYAFDRLEPALSQWTTRFSQMEYGA
jgi:chromosomal replication initiation ATPase DnaA